MLKRQSIYLHACTVLFVIALSLLVAKSLTQSSYHEDGLGAAERNERSTPRSFILPATPAVAEEQESQDRDLRAGVDSLLCLRRLKVLGYDLDDTPPVLTARNVWAIRQFQNDRRVVVTGRFDPRTAELLRCE